MIENIPFLTAMLLVVIGLYTVMFKKDVIKIIMGLSIMESGVNLFLVASGYVSGGVAPIYTAAPEGKEMVLPIPQALTLTSIVIGLATTALMLAFAIQIYRHYGTLKTDNIRRLKG